MTALSERRGADRRVEREVGQMRLMCRECGGNLLPVRAPSNSAGVEQCCESCSSVTACNEGIWIAMPPDRIRYFQRFAADYQSIREAEGRGSSEKAYYHALPYHDLSGMNAEQWAIRARSFDFLKRRIVQRMHREGNRPLRILDLGAGNGWMSFRLAELGHSPVAADILTNGRDGLGAAVHFADRIEPLFMRVQAELDYLPFASSAFDIAIFNASLHYSENYRRSFLEAFRCVRDGGRVIIADSPWYRHGSSGEEMVREKHARFRSLYGFSSNSIPSLEYLTPSRLDVLRSCADADWEVFKPFYGLRWSLRPLRAKLPGRRTPSQFHIYAARVKK